jgi:hypothetical protein
MAKERYFLYVLRHRKTRTFYYFSADDVEHPYFGNTKGPLCFYASKEFAQSRLDEMRHGTAKQFEIVEFVVTHQDEVRRIEEDDGT